VAGSRSPAFAGNSGQRSDLAIIEVALFFRTELLAAAAAAVAEATTAAGSSSSGGGGATEAADAAGPSTPTRQQQQVAAAAAAAAEAQPVILITNDNAQLQLAKSHGLPAFKLAGAHSCIAELAAGRGNTHSNGACTDRLCVESLRSASCAAGFETFVTEPMIAAASCAVGLPALSEVSLFTLPVHWIQSQGTER
jgi:hypothetical protein